MSDEGENLDSTEEFKVDEAMEMCKNPVPNHSYKELYTQDWLASKMNNGAEESSVSVPMVEIPKRIFDPLDPEGLMEHIETVPIPPKRGRGRPRKTPKFIPTVQVKEEPV